MEINEIIRRKLAAIDEDFDSLKPFMQEYLIKVENIIQEKTTIQNDAIEILKTNKFSVSSISKELGGSRTTMYNHRQLLKRYIEASETVLYQDNPFTICEDLKTSKSKLQAQVALMEERDIRVEIIKHNNTDLTRTIAEKDKEIERLLARLIELSTENRDLKTQLSKQRTISLSSYEKASDNVDNPKVQKKNIKIQ